MKIKITPPNPTGKSTSEDMSDISKYVGEIVLSDNINALGAHLTFKCLHPSKYDAYQTLPATLPIGTKVFLYTDEDELLFVGIIVKRTIDDMLGRHSYEAYDYAFYLNKSEINIQFNGIDASTAIKRVCDKQGVTVGMICDIKTKIRKIYHANLVIDVIRDILEQAELDLGTEYKLEMSRDGKLDVRNCADLEITLTQVPLNNIDVSTGGARPLDIQYSVDMLDTKTRITVVAGNERYTQVPAYAVQQDTEAALGMINEIMRVESYKSKAQLQTMANKRLEEVGGLNKSLVIKLFGDNRVRSGRRIIINNRGEFTLGGKFFVKSCVHTYTNNNYHTMELEVDVISVKGVSLLEGDVNA